MVDWNSVSKPQGVLLLLSAVGSWSSLMTGCDCGFWGVSGMGAISLRCSTQRPDDGKRRDMSPSSTGHWLTWEDDEEKGGGVKTEGAWEWLILSSTALQLWHITNVMAVIDSLCAISL